jgi:nitroreductase
MEIDELTQLIKGRRSIRRWQDKPVPEDMLLQAIELATWAPNGANRQNWFFYLIFNRDKIKEIADAMQAGTDYRASWPEMKQFGGFGPPPGTTPGATPPPAQPRSPMSAAPTLIAVATTRQENPLDKIMKEREKVDERAARMREWDRTIDSRIQSVSAAIAYLLLVLHQMGLGAVWMTGPLPSSKGDIEKILDVPSDTDIIALIPVGYPDESPTKDRKSVNEVCKIIK